MLGLGKNAVPDLRFEHGAAAGDVHRHPLAGPKNNEGRLVQL